MGLAQKRHHSYEGSFLGPALAQRGRSQTLQALEVWRVRRCSSQTMPHSDNLRF